MEMSLALRLPRGIHLCRPSSNIPCFPSFLRLLQKPHVLLTFGKVLNPLRLPGTPQLPKVLVSHLTRWLRTRHLSESTFQHVQPSGAAKHWKNTVLRDFSTFSRTWIFFLLTLSPLTALTTAADLSISRKFDF